MNKRILAAVIAALMVIFIVPAGFAAGSAEAPAREPEVRWTVPDGYNANDYNIMADFLEQTDANGVKNGEKLNNRNYDPNDPSTWVGIGYYGEGLEEPIVTWKNGRIYTIDLQGFGLCGSLMLVNCAELVRFNSESDRLGTLCVAFCPNVHTVWLGYTPEIVKLRMDRLDQLSLLHVCIGNNSSRGVINEFAITQCPVLTDVELDYGEGDWIRYADMGDFEAQSNASYGGGFRVCFDEEGNVSYLYAKTTDKLSRFVGWYTSGGTLLTEYPELYVEDHPAEYYVAKFENVYYMSDYWSVVNFLDRQDDQGVSNGLKLNPAYDRMDPSTFISTNNMFFDLEWITVDNVRYLKKFTLHNAVGMTGGLSLNGCSQLTSVSVQNVRDFPYVNAYNCPKLTDFTCSYCGVASIDVRLCYALHWITIMGNRLTALDLSTNTALDILYCEGTRLTDIDLSNNPLIPADRVYTDGGGYIGYIYGLGTDKLSASAAEGYEFAGWYSEGELVSENAMAFITSTEGAVYEARFAPIPTVIPGDMDGDGVLSFNDVSGLYLALLNGDAAGAANGDVDGNGEVNFADITALYLVIMG